MPKPILILGYGNPSRGDDALGPNLLDLIAQQMDMTQLELLTDFQLQIEHALDLHGRELVVFVDASVASAAAFDFTEIQAVKDNSYSSHAVSPAAILEVYQITTGLIPPPCFLLSIQGLSFELGGSLSDAAAENLQLAYQFIRQLLNQPLLDV